MQELTNAFICMDFYLTEHKNKNKNKNMSDNVFLLLQSIAKFYW